MEQVRKTKPSVTVFPYFIDEFNVRYYLLLKRDVNKIIDPDLVNGVGGYPDDWITKFFSLQASEEALNIVNNGITTVEGTFLWLTSDELIARGDLVPDLPHIWNDIHQASNSIFSATAWMGEKGLTIDKINVSRIPLI